jgi:hypothetical protein
MESYMTQSYVWRGDAGVHVLRPDARADQTAADGAVSREGLSTADPVGVFWLVSAWNPNGRPSTERLHADRTADLQQRLISLGTRLVGELTALAEDRSWLEDVLVVTGISQVDVVTAAREAGQPTVVAWVTSADSGQLTLVPTGLRDDVTPRTRTYVEEVVPPTCPMRTDRAIGERCSMYGGPFGSAAISAAALWQTHRQLLLDRLGCDACADGNGPIAGHYGGGHVSNSPASALLLASRYSSYVWQTINPDA